VNYLITTKCPKKCPYCFFPAKQKGKIDDMTLETFVACFEQQAKISIGISRRVALLGGEPTVAKYFKDIVGFIHSNLFRVNQLLIFSNLYGVENIRWLTGHSFQNIEFSIIWNSTGFSTYASNIKKNSFESLDVLKQNNVKIVASITLEPHQEVKDFAYLVEAKRIYGISAIRFALDTGNLPEFRTKGTKVYQILKFLGDNGFSIGIDGCGSPSLDVFNQDQINYLNQFNGLGVHCSGSAGVDILPDGTCIPCMPYLSFIGQRPNFTDLKSLDDIQTFYGFTPRTKMLCPARENIERLNLPNL